MSYVNISERVYKRSQSWHYERTVNVYVSDWRNGQAHKLKVYICRNAYDAQSYATVSRWDGSQWQNMVSAPITECECMSISYVQAGITAEAFAEDFARLLREAVSIVQ
jgi:hypothetical protein